MQTSRFCAAARTPKAFHSTASVARLCERTLGSEIVYEIEYAESVKPSGPRRCVLTLPYHCVAALAALQTLGAGDWHIRLQVFKEGMHCMWLVDINAVSG